MIEIPQANIDKLFEDAKLLQVYPRYENNLSTIYDMYTNKLIREFYEMSDDEWRDYLEKYREENDTAIEITKDDYRYDEEYDPEWRWRHLVEPDFDDDWDDRTKETVAELVAEDHEDKKMIDWATEIYADENWM